MGFNERYKDLTPEETVNNIKEFFESKGFDILILNNEQTQCGSWWCQVLLLCGKEVIGRANGKGATEEFSLASGYAELYERFANFINNVNGYYPINKKYKELNYSKYGYYLSPNERIVKFADVVQSSPRFQETFALLDDGKGGLQRALEASFNNKFVAVPFINVATGKEKYLVPELVTLIAGSDGMAAGNTVLEALVQGISEIYEHHIWEEIYKNTTLQYYSINLDNLNLNENTKNMLNNVKNLGYKIHCIDFSYTYGVPVLGIVVTDVKKKIAYLDLGSHPVFNIAFERLLTEVYQGNFSLSQYPKYMMRSFEEIGPIASQIQNMGSITGRNSYPENLLVNLIPKDTYNTDIFLQSESFTNEELYIYQDYLTTKLGWEIYYRDTSLSDKIRSVQIFVDNQDSIGSSVTRYFLQKLPNNKKTLLYKKLMARYDIINRIIDGKTVAVEECINAFSYINESDSSEKHFYTKFLQTDLISVYFKHKAGFSTLIKYFNDINLLNINIGVLEGGEVANFILEVINQYKILIAYQKSSLAKIQSIAQFYGQEYYIREDLENRSEPYYYLRKIIDAVVKEYQSDNFNKFLNGLIKEG